MKQIKSWFIFIIGVPALAVYFNIPTYVRTGCLLQTSQKLANIDFSFGKFNLCKAYRCSMVILEVLLTYTLTYTVTYTVLYLLALYILKCILFVTLVLLLGGAFRGKISDNDICMISSGFVMFITFLSFMYYYKNLLVNV